MMIKAVIIDFNGTLYLDHDLNDFAWGKAFESAKDKESNITFKQFFEDNIETLVKDYDFSKAILKTFNKDVSKEAIENLSNYKEETYVNLARSQKRNKLMEGAEEFLDYLKTNNIPYCIASMAPRYNFEFYLEYLNLKKWFTYDNIVYDDYPYKNKNDQYLEAAKRMNVDIKDCLIIEDSPKVILKALELGSLNFIYLNSKHKLFNIKEIKQEINNFKEFDLNILNKK